MRATGWRRHRGGSLVAPEKLVMWRGGTVAGLRTFRNDATSADASWTAARPKPGTSAAD